MKKITREIHPKDCSYKWLGKDYDKKPPFTVVRYYTVDEYGDVEARLRFRFLPLPFLAAALTYLLYITTGQAFTATIQLPAYMVVSNGILSADINNTGGYPAAVRIYQEDGGRQVIWLETELLPGTSLSNIRIDGDMAAGERTVKVNIVVANNNKASSYTNDMIVRILP